MRKIASLLLLTSLCLMLMVTVVPTTAEARKKPVPTPSVEITNPTNGETVADTVIITLTESAKIYIDGDLMTTGTAYSWDTTAYADGSHTINAEVSKKNKDRITVTVDNDGGTTPGGDGVVRKWAVIVGISDYKAISDLSYCDDDARDWAGYLNGYSKTTLIDRQASEKAIRNAVANMISSADADDQIAFISSGHGGISGKTAFLCAWDCGAGENGDDGYITDYEFESWFADIPCSTFIFLDHCSSGGMNEVMQSGIYMTVTCGARGYGYDAPQYQNGMWTYWFEEAGLEGQGFSTAESCFDWALAQYPYSGSDTPMEFDQLDGDFTF